jgi:flagellar biosynthesis protein FlhF
MDEVFRQLGENAFILSTSQRDGQIEIKATNDPIPVTKRTASPARQSFAQALAARSGEEDTTILQRSRDGFVRPVLKGIEGGRAPEPMRDNAQPEPQLTHEYAQDAAYGVVAKEPRSQFTPPVFESAARMAVGANASPVPLRGVRTSLTPTRPFASAPTPLRADVLAPVQDGALHRRIETRDDFAQSEKIEQALDRLQKTITGLVDTLAIAKPDLAHDLTANLIRNAGFDNALIADMRPVYSGCDMEDGSKSFVAALCDRIVAPKPHAVMDAQVIFISGPSGSGKTTLAAKFAAMLMEHRPQTRTHLIEVKTDSPVSGDLLRSYGRILNIPCDRWSMAHIAQSLNLVAGVTYIIDAPSDPEVADHVAQAFKQCAGKNFVAIVALPGGCSGAMIDMILPRYLSDGTVLALTKLDECESTPKELSKIAQTGAKIAWLSGTRALLSTLSVASREIVESYLTDCLSNKPASND